MDTLKATGLLKDTYVMWSADHGDGQGDHYHWRKGYPYELSSHIPLYFRWPETEDDKFKVPRGSVLRDVTELRDVFPTMLDAAGALDTVPHNYTMDGDTLLCLLTDRPCRTEKWRDYVGLEHSTCYNFTNHWNALTDGKMKVRQALEVVFIAIARLCCGCFCSPDVVDIAYSTYLRPGMHLSSCLI